MLNIRYEGRVRVVLLRGWNTRCRSRNHPRKMSDAEGILGRRLNGFLGLSLNDRNFQFLVMLLDKTVSVG